MKNTTRLLASILVLVLCVGVFAACGGSSAPEASAAPAAPAAPEAAPAAPAEPAAPEASGGGVINLWSFTDEVPKMVEKYKGMNPDFNYEIKTTIIATTDGAYQPALDQALAAGGSDAPDLFCAEAAFVLKYTQGDAANFAAAYKDLGIDVDALIKEADIAKYAYEVGTRGDGAIVGLPYQATGGAYIYRRSIAKDVWGTDDPDVIKDKIGPGWDKFLQGAAELKAKGYAIVSGDGDVWHPLENCSEKGWIVDGKLFVDPGREQFLDISKALTDNGYSNGTEDWQDPWFADMKDAGPQKVFGYFGPAWLINYVMAGNAGDTVGDWAICEPTTGFSWGGTWVIANKDSQVKDAVGKLIEWITLDSSETGLQYHWANGTLDGPGGTKDTVASGTVMAKSDGTLDFLGGQNMFDIFVPAGQSARGDNKSQYDETINILWRDQVRAYANGNKSREQALADFKQTVSDNLGIDAQ